MSRARSYNAFPRFSRGFSERDAHCEKEEKTATGLFRKSSRRAFVSGRGTFHSFVSLFIATKLLVRAAFYKSTLAPQLFCYFCLRIRFLFTAFIEFFFFFRSARFQIRCLFYFVSCVPLSDFFKWRFVSL